MGFFRAYGQMRRGTGAWRSPFLIPLVLNSNPVGFPTEDWHFAIDTGSDTPEVDIFLTGDGNLLQTLYDYLSAGDLTFTVTIRPFRGRVVSDISVRVVVLLSSNDLTVDGGAFDEMGVEFAVVELRLGPGAVLPRIDVTARISKSRINHPHLADVVDLAVPLTVAAGGVAVNTVGIGIDPVTPIAVDVSGGLVSGVDVVKLRGIESRCVTGADRCSEIARDIRGVDLAWLENPGAQTPPEATLVRLRGPEAQPVGRLSAVLHALTRPDVPSAPAPAVEGRAGGYMRPGSYRYRLSYLDTAGNESSLGQRSAQVRITESERSVAVSQLALSLPKGIATLRVYRTDTDTSAPATGARGDEVLVAELPIGVADFLDTGEKAAQQGAGMPTRFTDLVAVEFDTDRSFEAVGQLRMIDASGETTYRVELPVPKRLRLLMNSGASPTLRWSADSTTPRARLVTTALETPLGEGAEIRITTLPQRLDLVWVSLGSQYFALGLTCGAGQPVGRVGAALGVHTLPKGWPANEASVTADIDAAGSLIVLSQVVSARVEVGAVAWADRDAADGRLGVEITLLDDDSIRRNLRLGYRDAGSGTWLRLSSGYDVPARLNCVVRIPTAGPTSIDLRSRFKWLRGAFGFAATSATVSGQVMIDDTSDHLYTQIASERVTATVATPVRVGGRIDVDSGGTAMTIRPDLVVPAGQFGGLGDPREPSVTVALPPGGAVAASTPDPGISGRLAWVRAPANPNTVAHTPLSVRANPQGYVLSHGDLELDTGLRAVTGRIVGLRSVQVDPSVFGPAPPLGESTIVAEFAEYRPNHSIRFEAIERERQVPTNQDLRALPEARSWCRARVEKAPERLSLTLAHVRDNTGATSLGGLIADASSVWGGGAIWAEPSYVWDLATRRPNGVEPSIAWDLGLDRGIGLLSVSFDRIPTRVEYWNLAHAVAVGTAHVPANLRLPTVGPAGGDWVPGGALVRATGRLGLRWLRLAVPKGAALVCRTDGYDRPVRYGTWSGIIAPFITLEPVDPTGPVQLTYWDTSAPRAPQPAPPQQNPCKTSPPGGAALGAAQGWSIGASTRVTLVANLYGLNTPSGPVTARWRDMPTRSEEWKNNDEPQPAGIWQLQTAIQMEAYGGTVAMYPLEKLDNPFGPWRIGPGKWWLRRRRELDVICANDAYFGNVDGGYHLLTSEGVYSTLPPIFSWSYP